MDHSSWTELTACHGVLLAGEDCAGAGRRVFMELLAEGLPAPPLLVHDLVTATCGEASSRNAAVERERADDVARCMREAASSLRRALGPGSSGQFARERAAKAFLASWIAAAPRPESASPALHELERTVLQRRDPDGTLACPWTRWRAVEEQAMRDGGSPDFLRALAEFRGATPGGFAATDERIWTIRNAEIVAPRYLDVASGSRSGVEPEWFRSQLGPFREVAAHGMPADPCRIVVSDMALLGHAGQAARALLAAKIADATLSVRFGSMPRSASRRPRVLLVVALEDDILSHVHGAGRLSPDVEPLREAIVHAIPSCLRVLAGLGVDFEAEVRRSGPLSNGRLTLQGLRGRSGQLAPHLRTAPRVLGMLAREAPWLFADAPFRPRPQPAPGAAAFDASFLVTAGRCSRLRSSTDWAGLVMIEPIDDVSLRVRSSGPALMTLSETIPLHDPERVATVVASVFGTRPMATAPGGADSSHFDDGAFA
jgi:hypothetical protein